MKPASAWPVNETEAQPAGNVFRDRVKTGKVASVSTPSVPAAYLPWEQAFPVSFHSSGLRRTTVEATLQEEKQTDEPGWHRLMTTNTNSGPVANSTRSRYSREFWIVTWTATGLLLLSALIFVLIR